MRINVITVDSGWILQKISERIVLEGNKLGHEFILSHSPSNYVDCNFYVDIQNCYSKKTNTLDIGLFTHVDRDDMNTVNHSCLTLDYIIHMCNRYYESFKSIYSEDKMSVLYPSETNTKLTEYKPKIGVFQRGRYEGKGFNFLMSLSDPIIKNFRFKFVGKDWDQVVSKLTSMGVEVEYVTSEDYSKYPSHYHDVDYVLIPSLWEGGPISVLEALACGKPVISSDVGFVGDFKVDYTYQPNDMGGLVNILKEIIEPIKIRRNSVSEVTYKNYTEGLIKIIKQLK